MEAKTRVRYAVVGIGNIAEVAVLPAFAHAKQNSELAVVSGDPEKRAEPTSRRPTLSTRTSRYARRPAAFTGCVRSR